MPRRPNGSRARRQTVSKRAKPGDADPREFELPGREAIMRKEGPRLVIEPARKKSLIEILKSLEPIDEDFPEIKDPPPEEINI
jgi:antitoxin VapB